MVTRPRSQLYRLIEASLDCTLPEYIERSRQASMSWRSMAADLHEKTGITVSYQTLRDWFAHRLEVRVEVKVA